jgi:RNA polymerase sigma-70 factor, ECF subfamily
VETPEEKICIQNAADGGYTADRVELHVRSADNHMLQFPGNYQPDDMQATEAREDARLLTSIADGDQLALASLYQRRGTLLYSLLARILGNDMEAQEILQDTFMLIWRRAHEYDPARSSPLAWMVMIGRGRALDLFRSRSRRQANHAAYEQEMVSLEVELNRRPQIDRDELAAVCKTVLNELPEAQSRALQLAFLRGWTHEEIARATNEPLGTIKARVRRGLLAMRKAMKDYHA